MSVGPGYDAIAAESLDVRVGPGLDSIAVGIPGQVVGPGFDAIATELQGVLPTSIASAESFGTPSVAFAISPTSIASAESFGTPTVEYTGLPTIESAEAEQRDTSTTWLVDVDLVAHDQGGEDLSVEVDYSTDGPSGPWVSGTAQEYDRHHSCPLEEVPTEAPGRAGRFVWNAFLDLIELPEAVRDIYLRVRVINESAGTDEEIIGPVEVSTVRTPVTPTPRAATLPDLHFLGHGLDVPFERASRDFRSASREELVRACVRSIFATRAAVGAFAGDLPWRPDFGHKLWVLRHRNNDALLRGLAHAYVLEALGWEPRALVVDVSVENTEEPNRLRVRLRYQVITEDVPENRVILPEFEESIPIS